MVNSLNNIFIEGNLTKDPEIRQTGKGTPVCNLSVASNRYIHNGDEKTKEVSFFDVEVWAKQAEACKAFLAKGRGVRIRGRLKQDRWQDESGKWQTRVKIVSENVEFKPQFQPKEGEGAAAGPVARGAGEGRGLPQF